jgi:hypothetical protein
LSDPRILIRGFFGHWTDNERNPLMPDLLVIDYPLQRAPLFLEFKTANKWQPGQKQAVCIGLWRAAWTMAEARAIVEAWEGEG